MSFRPDWQIPALDRARWQCERCGTTNEAHLEEHGRGLHVHHRAALREGGSNDLENLEVVCVRCHGPADTEAGTRGRHGRTKWFDTLLNVRLTERDGQRLAGLAEKLEIPRADVVRQAIRELAKREKIEGAE